MNNSAWAKQIIHELDRQGVRHFCIAPGSRSTPLAIAVAEENAAYSTHFDERGLGFFALGFAKSAKHPVAIIVTSGTAVGNLLPSVMEAWHDDVPLVLLTADRPPELRDCGANQTTDQVKVFSSFVHFQVDLPCPFANGEHYLAGTISYGIHLSKSGPVHFNCMFREPLYTGTEPCLSVKPTQHFSPSPQIDELAETLADELKNHKKGLILCGERADPAALALAEHLQWPLFAEIPSGLRGVPSTAAIPYYEHILKSKVDLTPTAIVHCGGRLLSKQLMEWCHKLDVKVYAHIDDRPSRFDPYKMVTHRFEASISAITPVLLEQMSKNDSEWLAEWRSLSIGIGEALLTHLDAQELCTEPGLMHELREQINHRHGFFLSSSMPIRDANFFFFPKQEIGPIYCNRGLSGIDGNIATVAGLAKGSGKPLIAVIGDLAALHDLNSLALIEKSPVPILLIVINNQGAAIFSFLPHLAKAPHYEELFANRHTWEFEGAASMFSLPYLVPETKQHLQSALETFSTHPTNSILELRTERTANHILHQELETLAREANFVMTPPGSRA